MKTLNHKKMRNEKPKDEAKYLYDRMFWVFRQQHIIDENTHELVKRLAWEAVDIMMGQLDPDEMSYWIKVKKKIQKL